MEHINVQEAYALGQLSLFCADRPLQVRGSTLMVDVDNQVLFHGFQRGKARNTGIHQIITDLFWLQIQADFLLKVQRVSSKQNAEADDLSRQEADAYVRLEHSEFEKLWNWTAAGFDMDLMATPASAQRRVGGEGVLPFYSRFQTQGCAGTDVLSQDLRVMPGSKSDVPVVSG